MILMNKDEATFAVFCDDCYIDLKTPLENKKIILDKTSGLLLKSVFKNPDKVASIDRFKEILSESNQQLTESEVYDFVDKILLKLENKHKLFKGFMVKISSGFMLHHSWEESPNNKIIVPEICHKNLNSAVQTISRQFGMVKSICKNMTKDENEESYVLSPGKLQKDLDFIIKTYDVVISLVLEETNLNSKSIKYIEIEKQLNKIRNYIDLNYIDDEDLEKENWPDLYVEKCYKETHKLAGQLKDF